MTTKPMTPADPRDGLPELPEAALIEQSTYLSRDYDRYYTADQMRAYAHQCIAHARPEAVDEATTDALRIPEQPGLDPITCYFEDYAPGRGRITIACYGDAWTAAWGAMGNRTVREFVASAPPDYLACSMLELTPATTRRRKYAERIASAVIAALTPDQSP